MRSTNGIQYQGDKLLMNCVMLVKKRTILKLMLNSQYYSILQEMADGEINLQGDYIECYVGFMLEYYHDDLSYHIDRMKFTPNDLKNIFIDQSLNPDDHAEEDHYFHIIRQMIDELFDTLPHDKYFSLNGPYDDKFRIP